MYPKHKYKKSNCERGFAVVIVNSETDEKALGEGYCDSPADFGVETHPVRVDAPPADAIPVFVAPAEPVKKSRKGAA